MKPKIKVELRASYNRCFLQISVPDDNGATLELQQLIPDLNYSTLEKQLQVIADKFGYELEMMVRP